MHRSGTSLCANVLARLGVNMADGAGASPENPRGHWERHRINDLHDEVFAMLGGRWGDPAHDLALPAGWWQSPAVEAVGSRIAATLRPAMAAHDLAGFKDPRTARLLPMWDRILDRLEAEPRFVFCVRDPAQVARSVEARDRSARAQAEYRWLIYNAQALHGIGSRAVCIIPYEAWFSTPVATAHRLAEWIRPDEASDPIELERIVASVVDADLRHDSLDERRVATPAAAKLRDMILACVTQDHLSPALQDYAERFLEFEQAVTPLLRDGVMLRASVAEQNRVIHDLQCVLRRVRTAAQ